MIFSAISKADTTLYKGIAIMLIVVHNFMHRFPSPKEMEFSFYSNRFQIFLNSLMEPTEIIRVLFSYFGHYGVQVFIFLSAYGLTKRYLNNKLLFRPFLVKRLLTIYPSFLLAFIVYAILTANYQTYGILAPLKHIFWDPAPYFYKIFMLSNFIPGEEFQFVGPWWFLSFIFQFYLVFPFLLKYYLVFKNSGLLILAIISIIVNQVTHGHLGGINLYFTVIGHLPEFCLGMFFAKSDHIKLNIPNSVLMASLFIFYLGNVHAPFWHMSHLSFLLIILAFLNLVKNSLLTTNLTKKFFTYLGVISMPLFLVNGFLREPFLSLALEYNHWFVTIVLSLTSFLVAIFVAIILLKTENALLSIFSKKNRERTVTPPT